MRITRPWLKELAPQPLAALRLICFPHAGGSAASYRLWPRALAPKVGVLAVQYPGRAERYDEPLVDDMRVAVSRIADEIEGLQGAPYAFFGHSMGGAMAYEVACLLLERGIELPRHIFISGRQPPMHHKGGVIHAASDKQVMKELLRLSPLNSVLLEEPELAELMLPIIRNDYRLIESYMPRKDPVILPVPITVLLGDKDEELTFAQACDWGGYTSCGFAVHVFPGDHFFFLDECADVTELIGRVLFA